MTGGSYDALIDPSPADGDRVPAGCSASYRVRRLGPLRWGWSVFALEREPGSDVAHVSAAYIGEARTRRRAQESARECAIRAGGDS